ncbi:hypothetical protein Trco_002503 [Trichoderma cornu-damae]|uniref:Zn(2)-C6 fungal-type domain-containing protein n=1 Tax=Trichoderma cornu-damae TaxID=654480 RepID=A0A9P8TYJ5_9HYPO|nr:hypothetical protein Trco_002503 [Trichoderma cornu-damae]
MTRRVIASGRSCLECRRRKIKCDRSLPCAYCTRTKLQCTYPSWRPNRNAAAEGDLAVRVQSIESALKSLEHKITHIGSLLHVDSEITSKQGHGGQGHQFSTSLPFDGSIDASQPLESLHPPPSSISFIWQTYLDVVDPLLKIFHIPSTQRHVMSISQGRGVPDAPTECLVFAIYYSTVISMSAAECRDELDEERPVLLQSFRYREGIERALICGRQDENGPDVCSLIGLAIGNAMKLGLHTEIPGMRTFELEMRRRLWWQIRTLDVRIAEDFGGDPYIIESSPSTQLPLNINDISLDPEMGDLPNPQPGRSEMLFSLVRFEVSHFARRILFSDRFCQSNGYQIMNEAQKCQAVDQFKERIEKQYFSYCYKAVPLDCITIASNRLILAKLKLAVCKPGIDQNYRMPLRANYRKACEEVLEHAHALRKHSKGRRWLWLFQTYVEWDPLAYLLLDYCITMSSPSQSSSSTFDESNAVPWKVVDESYNHWKNNPDVHRDRRWANIEELRSQALSIKEKAQNAIQTPQPIR